jgi:hypothetical protein
VYLPRLPADTPFYALAGNHDHLGDVTMQLAYAALQPQWHFPHLYHTFTPQPVGGSGPTVQVVVVDTMVRAWALGGGAVHSLTGAHTPTRLQEDRLDEIISERSSKFGIF